MKRRNGFVSNSSSSSFVLFGVNVENDVVATLAWETIKGTLLERYGSLDDVPAKGKGYNYEEELYHQYKDCPEDITDEGSYELGEIAGCSYADEYTGFWIGHGPTWFEANPDKTYNDLKQIILEQCATAGMDTENLDITYIEEEIC